MAIVRWEPLRELSSLQNEMNRLFGTVFDAPSPANGSTLRRWMPAMDLVETDEHFVLRADLPGLPRRTSTSRSRTASLTVSGERKAEHEATKEGYHRVERAFGSFSRSLTLPEGVDAEAVTANFDRGVLEIRIPKPEQRKPRKISIGVGDTPKTIEGESPAVPPARVRAPLTARRPIRGRITSASVSLRSAPATRAPAPAPAR